MNANESQLFVAGLDGRIFRFNLPGDLSGSGSTPSMIMTGHTKSVVSLALSFDGASLISASLDGIQLKTNIHHL